MRWIASLIALQLVLISMQFYWIFNLEQRFEAVPEPPVQSAQTDSLQTSEPVARTGQRPAGLDEQTLRRIIRAELSALRQSDAGAPSGTGKPEAVIDPVENAYRLKAVREELAYHIEQGEISDQDMRNLKAEIARLDPDSRANMLRELVAALNSGQLKGRL